MEKLLLFILVFVSCSNPKADIVEREKSIKKQLPVLENRRDSLKARVQEKAHQMDLLFIRKGDTTGYHAADSAVYDGYSTAAVKILNQIDSLNEEYDSLEMELKKY